jgi:alkylation response protein AidB-like acyl-CoA dehydrogenase
MDFSLSSDQTQFITQLEIIIEEELVPYYKQRKNDNRSNEFDWTPIDILRKHNLLCPVIPKEYGGLGLDFTKCVMLMEKIAFAAPCLASIIATNIHAVLPVLLGGNESQKETILPDFAGSMACLGSFALTEKTGGSMVSNFASMVTTNGNETILTGRKDYILNAPIAKYISTFAFTSPLRKRSTLRCYIVAAKSKGVSVGQTYHFHGMSDALVSELNFTDVKIDDSMSIKSKESYSGYLLLSQILDIGRALVGGHSVGIASKAFDIALGVAKKRMQGNRPIFDHQAISHSLAHTAIKIESARLLSLEAGWKIDNDDEDAGMLAAMSKVLGSNCAENATRVASEIVGAHSLLEGNYLEFLRSHAHVLSTIEGTNNILMNDIASLL